MGRMNRILSIFLCGLGLFLPVVSCFSQDASGKSVWLSDLDLVKMTCVMGIPKVNQSILGAPIQIGGIKFEHGVGTHAYSRMLIDLHGQATSFTAQVGLDDGAYKYATIAFFVLGDKKLLWESGPVKRGEKARPINIDLTGVNQLGLLVTVVREDISENYADWAEARIDFKGEKPVPLDNIVKAKQFGILTPPAPPQPRINGPDIYGVRPGSPFLYRIPVTGTRPIQFNVANLPKGLHLDVNTGIITGVVSQPGRYTVTLSASNVAGRTGKHFTIIAGDQLALTPPMGWNSWYIYHSQVSDSEMRISADAMIRTGMADYGYQYVNIDDGWMNKPGSKDPAESGPLRNAEGEIMGNKRFPDMKGLTSFIHAKGLKAGIYSSPGPITCAGFAGSYQHVMQDAGTFANWGFDFLKYDWCSYGTVVHNDSLSTLKAPFLQMGSALKKTGRDIVFNLCQYGMGSVWKWGSEAGHSWRTGPDLGTATGGFIPGFYNVAINNSAHCEYAHPGAWNDPDYLNMGWVGGYGGASFKKTAFTNNECYAYMSLWALMASPLFFSGDLTRLDPFLLNVLCNHEVIAVNQDVLGRQAKIIRNDSTGMVMVREMKDGSKVVGFFNYPGDKKNPVDYFAWNESEYGTRKIKITGTELGIKGTFRARNLWTQKELGSFDKSFEAEVPYHGVVLIKISK